MNDRHPAQTAYGTAVGASRRSLQHRLRALRAGLRAALRAFRTHSVKHSKV